VAEVVEVGVGDRLTLSDKYLTGSFAWFEDGSNRFVAHNDLYVKDLDGDGIDEIVFAGFETQPNTPAEFSPISVAIFGWKAGRLQDLTQQWMPSGINRLEGVGDVVFGDFNGDGRTDIFFSGYADMDHSVSAYAFLNKGGVFERQDLGKTRWEHGATVGDLNGDGFDDVVVVGYLNPVPVYFGSSQGLTKSFLPGGGEINSYEVFASGAALGFFLDSQRLSLVVTDSAPADDARDTRLLKTVWNGSSVQGFEYHSTLPIPLLDAQASNIPAMGKVSHDVRARSVDLNSDGLDDIVIWSREGWNGTQWPERSQMQFLLNQGGGRFADVTGSLLIGYNINSNATYSPVLRDINNDGLLDIFVSASSFGSTHASTSLFLGTNEGTFTGVGYDLFSPLVSPAGGVATVAKGPDQNFYLITSSSSTSSSGRINYVHAHRMEFGTPRGPDIVGTNGDDRLIGTDAAELVLGLGGNDTLVGGFGNDTLDGGYGFDTAIYAGQSQDYVASRTSLGWEVAFIGPVIAIYPPPPTDGVDLLTGIERIQFADKTIALDTEAVSGQAYRVYKAAFNREPDAGGLGYWIAQMDSGMTLTEAAARFIDSNEFRAMYGTSPTDEQYLTKVYQNVLGRDPEPDGYNWWLNEIRTNPEKTRAKVLADFSESAENKAGTAQLVGQGIVYEPWVGS